MQSENVIKKKKALHQCPLLWVDGLNQVVVYIVGLVFVLIAAQSNS